MLTFVIFDAVIFALFLFSTVNKIDAKHQRRRKEMKLGFAVPYLPYVRYRASVENSIAFRVLFNKSNVIAQPTS